MAKDKGTSVYFDRDKLHFIGLDTAHLQQLKDTYPTVDVESELKKMGLWLTSSKGTKRKGNIGFIINWLNNASPKTPIEQEPDLLEQDTPLRPWFDTYLKELWDKNNALHILEMNKRRIKS